MAIRYDKNITKEINRTITNFNQKIRRLEKLDKDLLLPSKISKKELISEVTTRNELNKKLKELQRYSKRGIEETKVLESGTKISIYEYENLKREIRTQKSQLTREINKLSATRPTVFGKVQVATLREMGSMRIKNLEARRKSLENKLETLDREGLTTLKRRLEQNRLKTRYRKVVFMDNYSNEMLFNLAYHTGYDKDKIKYISDKLKELTPQQFLNLYNTEEGLRSIMDYYPIDVTMNPEIITKDIHTRFDALYESIDDIVNSYK